MSTDFQLIDRERAAFEKAHPRENGWKVYVVGPSARQRFMAVLPAFLRLQLGEGNFTERIITDVCYGGHSRRAIQRRLTALPWKGRRAGMREDEWTGEVDFDWKGSPVHIRRFDAADSMGSESRCCALIACKDWKVLDSFYTAGIKFIRPRQGYVSDIQVVNGRNIPRPKSTWDDVILPDGARDEIRAAFESFLKARRQYKSLGLPYRRGFLFAGPPGNGKTLVTKVLLAQNRLNAVMVTLRSDLEEAHLDLAFAHANANRMTILVLEDLDKLVVSHRVGMGYLLNKLDGLTSEEGIIVLATTNHPERLDPALLHRPSRFDRVWTFPLPGHQERLAMMAKRGGGAFSPAALEEAARLSNGFSMAYVQECVVSALMMAIHEEKQPSDEHLLKSVNRLRRQIRSADKAGNPPATPGVGFGPATSSQ